MSSRARNRWTTAVLALIVAVLVGGVWLYYTATGQATPALHAVSAVLTAGFALALTVRHRAQNRR